jgi:CBS domain-containing protein
MNVAAILKLKGRAVSTARADITLLDIARRLSAKKIGAIVITAETGGVIGIVSERDIIRVVGQKGPEALSLPVGDVMTRQVVTCTLATTLDELMATMTAGRFRHIPVMEDGDLAGIVSIGDVVKHHVAEVEMEASAMRSYLTAG